MPGSSRSCWRRTFYPRCGCPTIGPAVCAAVMRRAHVVRQRTRLKNQVHAILARNLAPTPPLSRLVRQDRSALARRVSRYQRTNALACKRCCGSWTSTPTNWLWSTRNWRSSALTDPMVARLMTIPGVDAARRALHRGRGRRLLPVRRSRQVSGLRRAQPARCANPGTPHPVHGRISKAGRAHVRGVLVEAAWSASRAPGPAARVLRRIKARRGFQTAIVATARKMTVLAWHLVTKDEDYAFARPGAGHPQAP